VKICPTVIEILTSEMVFKSLPFPEACFTYGPWSWLTSASTQLSHWQNKNKQNGV